MQPSLTKTITSVLISRQVSRDANVLRAAAETRASGDQLTPWEVVIVGDGSTEIRARFKCGWMTLADMNGLYCTGNSARKDGHNGGENAARIAHAMNLAYPIVKV